jgi:hypothetical protein
MNTFSRFFFAGCLLLLTACTKEDAKLPYSQITAFTIKDADGNTLSAAITDQDIIVYWPFGQTLPADITPQITVSDQATIKPASGERVAFNGNATYVVTAQNGTTASYKIKIISNQPTPVLTGLQIGSQFILPGTVMNINHLYLIQDKSRTHFSLISKKGEKLPCPVVDITRDRAGFTFPQTLDTGRYNLQVESGTYSAIVKTVFLYRAGFPELYDYGALTLKRGQTFTVSGNYLTQISKASLYLDFSKDRAIEVISNTATTVTLRIPLDFPVGTCEGGLGMTNVFYDVQDAIGYDTPIVITN